NMLIKINRLGHLWCRTIEFLFSCTIVALTTQ
ncbi:MAG: hypothetical protein ACI9RI_000910, partial [Oceanospirillaceae bacterium]